MSLSRSLTVVALAAGLALALRPGPALSQAPAPRYHNAERMESFLEDLARRHKDRLRLHKFGKSHEKRTLWAVEVTDFSAGKAEDKPGVCVVAGLQGDEPGSSEVALRMLTGLMDRAGPDATVAELLRTRVLYVIPRLNPDGVERSLATVAVPQRDALAPLDDDNDEATDEDGPQDVDGDGLILQMRLRDAAGEWRADPADPRLMVRKKPGETGEWRLFPAEGRDVDGDGEVAEDGPGGTNLDRNFPALWQWRTRQPGAGPFMASAEETRALMDFMLARPNIALVEAPRATAGQPFLPATRNGAALAGSDRAWLDAAGKRWETATGGKLAAASAEAGDPGMGTFLDWAYLHFGALAVSPDVWQAPRAAGTKPEGAVKPEAAASGEKAWLEWNERELGGTGFVAWRPFNHPQLGMVEIGGWRPFTRRNPPPERLAALAEKELDFLVGWAGTTALAKIGELKITPRGANVHQVLVTITNTGGAPTASAQGVLNRTTRPVLAILDLPEGAQLLSGIKRVRLGQLEPGETKAVEWTVLAPAGAKIKVTANAQRGGSETREATL